MYGVLRDGLRFCSVGEQFVFLDVVGGRYFALSDTANSAFSGWLSGQIPESLGFDQLFAGSILVGSDIDIVRPQAPDIVIPKSSFFHAGTAHISTTVRALLEFERAKFAVKRQTLADILASSARKRLFNPVTAASGLVAAKSVGAALQWAGKIVSMRDACMAKSIAAMRMLSGCDRTAKLVIGVRLNPFMAHCWVLNEHGLVTDHFDHVESFTPILVI